MGYRIQIENGNCLNCGVCMDVCPVQALDMSRPQRPGVEGAGIYGVPFDWMMEYPVQSGSASAAASAFASARPTWSPWTMSRAHAARRPSGPNLPAGRAGSGMAAAERSHA